MGFFDSLFSDNEAPAPRNLYQEGRDTLQAKIDLAPQQYEMRAKYDPLYASLASQTQRQSVLDSLGMYDATMPRVASLSAQANTTARGSDIADVLNLGPRAVEAYRAYNPAGTRLLDTMTGQAQNELDLGASLDPSMRRETVQAIRAGQTARGMGFGTRDLAEEIYGVGQAAQAMRDRRRAYAQTVLGNNQAAYGDPLQAILGRSSGAVPTAMSITGAGGGGAPSFDPFDSYAQDLYNTNFNAAYNDYTMKNNNMAGLVGGLLGAGGKLGGAAITANGYRNTGRG